MAGTHELPVIATTISGSVRDWGKVERIVPLFRAHGRSDVTLHVVRGRCRPYGLFRSRR